MALITLGLGAWQEYPIQASTEFTSEDLFLSLDFFSLKFYIEVDYFVY